MASFNDFIHDIWNRIISAVKVQILDSNGDPVDTFGTPDGATETTLEAVRLLLDTVETKLQAIADNTDGLEGYTDGLETLLTDLKGLVDGLEGFVDGIETSLGTSADASSATGSLHAKLRAAATALEILDNIVSGSEAQVDVVTLPDSLDGPGAPVIDSYTSDDVNLAANTANQSVVAAPGSNKQIWVYGLVGTTDVAGSISIQDEDDAALSGVMPVAATGGFVMNPSGNFAMPWIKVATNKALEIDTVTCAFDGIITYAIVSV